MNSAEKFVRLSEANLITECTQIKTSFHDLKRLTINTVGMMRIQFQGDVPRMRTQNWDGSYDVDIYSDSVVTIHDQHGVHCYVVTWSKRSDKLPTTHILPRLPEVED
ncbi:MAG: hypothetical protein U0514_01490 [Candidatus Andersenbacteria bacterium]